VFLGKSWTLKEAGLIIGVFEGFEAKAGCVIAAGANVCGRKEV
jgi:hypothetical protein